MGLARLEDVAEAPASHASNLRVTAISEVAVRAAQLALLVAAARTWGPERFGVYAFAGSFAAIVIALSDFGLQLHLARAIAQRGGRRSLRAVVRAKLLLSALTSVVLVAASALEARPGVGAVLLAAGAVVLAQSWCDLWNHYFRGRQTLRDEAWLNALYMIGGAAAAGLALALGAGALGVYLVLLAAALVGNALGWRRVRALAESDPADAPEAATQASASASAARAPTARDALRAAAPIGLATILGTIYFRSDMVLLGWLRGDAATGAYGAAYRLFEGGFVLPALVLAALFPALAERVVAPREEIGRLVRRATGWMALLGLAAAAFLAFAVAPFLERIYGADYAESATLLQMLAPALCFIFPNYVLLHFLVAAGRQAANAWIAALGVPVCLGLNLALIPSVGARGAAVATVATEVVLFCAALLVAERTIARRPASASTAP
jgi:O-antigen/teichoic acid export membrane protein